MQDRISKILKENNGYIQTKQLQTRSEKYKLKKMLENGQLEKVKHGLYRDPSISKYESWGQVCMMIPSGVLCLFSAWHFHELTTHVSSIVHVAIENKKKIVLPNYPPVKLYYWTSEFQKIAIIETQHNNELIRVYNIEKSVCDAVKFRNKIGIDMTSEILKNYIKRKDRNLDLLMRYAKTLKVSELMTKYLNMMI